MGASRPKLLQTMNPTRFRGFRFGRLGQPFSKYSIVHPAFELR